MRHRATTARRTRTCHRAAPRLTSRRRLQQPDVANGPFGHGWVIFHQPGVTAARINAGGTFPATVTTVTAAVLSGALELDGTAKADQDGTVVAVGTFLHLCGGAVSPDACRSVPSPMYNPFTTHNLSGPVGTPDAPIHLLARQVIQTVVRISFSSASLQPPTTTAPAPVISSFTASKQQVTPGEIFTVLPTFSNGTAVVTAQQQSSAPFVLGNATSGQSMVVASLYSDTAVVLTVTNQAGVVATATLPITVTR